MGNKRKVVIIGAGNVGATLGYQIVSECLCKELYLIDINKEKVLGEVMDLQHAAMFTGTKVKVKAGEYSDCSDADIVVITACAPMDPKANDRLGMVAASKRIMEAVIPGVMDSGFNGIILVVSNPVDIMTYYAWKLSGLPNQRVIGSGTVLDTARLTGILSDLFKINPKSIDINVIGEHGDSEVVVWSTATIGGKKIEEVMKDNQSRSNGLSFEEIRQKTIGAGWEIFHRKGNTSYGIASSVSSIISSILNDDESIKPVSVYMNGLYGLKGGYMSMPAVINHSGIREIVELNLAEDELQGMKDSFAVILKTIRELS